MGFKGFTLKSLVFGLVGVLITSCLPHYSGKVLEMGDAIKGYLPLVPLFLIVMLSLVWNVLMGRLGAKWMLTGRELAVIFGLMLMVSWIPGLQQNMVRQTVLTRYEELTTNTTWKEAGVTARLPERLFPRGSDGEAIGEATHLGMIQGKMPVDSIPYKAWVSPLLNWMPLIIVVSVCLMAMMFVVHRQWASHEQLRYPLASVVDSLIRQDPAKRGGSIYRNRLFWYGFAFVFGYQLLRYLYAWFPTDLPKIPNEYSLAWGRLFPAINESNAGFFLLSWMPVSFALIGIAFFLPSDASLSMGLTAPLGTIFGVYYYMISGDPVSSASLDVFRAGGFIAFGIILAYTGRSYYFPILMKAIWPARKGADPDPGGVWAARVFLLCYVLLILIVASMGVDALMAWIIVTFFLLVFLVVTRLVCETGLPSLVPGWSMPTVLSGLLGPSAVGAAPLMFITFLGSTLISPNSSQLAMPYMATALKVLDDHGVNLKRFALVAKIAILIALLAGFAAIITVSYTKGQGNLSNSERGVWNQSVRQVLTMMDMGQYERSESANGLSKLALVRPDSKTVGLVTIGLMAVLLCYLLRFRYSKWPLHPLFFVVLGTRVSNYSWMCFLLGWVIKIVIVKVGGGSIYNKTKPLFVGFIIGEFMAIVMMLIVGLSYYLITGNKAPSLWML